jgi:hypothetical protein
MISNVVEGADAVTVVDFVPVRTCVRFSDITGVFDPIGVQFAVTLKSSTRMLSDNT